jgi:hypothetical protein
MLIHCDGFDHYATAQATPGQKWDEVVNATIGATYARSGGQGCQLGNAGATLGKIVPAQTTYIVGQAYKWSTANDSTNEIFTFMDGTTIQVSVHNFNGVISAFRNGTVLLATASTTIGVNQYRYLEAKVFVDPTVGTVTVRMDGAVILSFTGNTRQSGTSQITK